MIYLFDSPIGSLTLYISQNKLVKIDFPPAKHALQNCSSNTFTQQISFQLESYFKNPCYLFNLELELTGTPFQQKVWHALRHIPSGTTLSYNALAKQLATSPRAIGNACRSNPLPIIIPCHRIVAQNHIGGFAGTTTGTLIDIKKWLLQHEAV